MYICPCHSLTSSQLTLPPPHVLKSILYVLHSFLNNPWQHWINHLKITSLPNFANKAKQKDFSGSSGDCFWLFGPTPCQIKQGISSMNDNQVILCPNPAVPSLPSEGNPFSCCSGLMQRGSEISPENISGGGQWETEWEVGSGLPVKTQGLSPLPVPVFWSTCLWAETLLTPRAPRHKPSYFPTSRATRSPGRPGHRLLSRGPELLTRWAWRGREWW